MTFYVSVIAIFMRKFGNFYLHFCVVFFIKLKLCNKVVFNLSFTKKNFILCPVNVFHVLIVLKSNKKKDIGLMLLPETEWISFLPNF